MNNKWCICNNTGIIFIRASFNNEIALSCPICNEYGCSLTMKDLVQIIQRQKIDGVIIKCFRMNKQYCEHLTEDTTWYKFGKPISFEMNGFYGIPVKIDDSIQDIEIDY